MNKYYMRVRKCKCIGCDLIFFVELFDNHVSTKYKCPQCKSRIMVYKIDDTYISEEPGHTK
jgi:DNA-directed RNA polymerase subunit RPC12/RpoP